MTKMTKVQRLEDLIRLLDVNHPRHSAADEVREALGGPARIYLQSWVLPYLRELHEAEERAAQRRKQKR